MNVSPVMDTKSGIDIETLFWNGRFAVNGVSIYNAVDADEEDAYETEGATMDACGAHSDAKSRWVSDPHREAGA